MRSTFLFVVIVVAAGCSSNPDPNLGPKSEPIQPVAITLGEAYTAYDKAYVAALASSKGMDRYDEEKNEREAHNIAMQSMKTLPYRKAHIEEWVASQK